MINIVHVTDLHFGSSHNYNTDSKPGTSELKRNIDFSPTEYFSEALKSLSPKADLILMSGDFLTGKDSPHDYSPTIGLLNTLSSRQSEHFNTEQLTCDVANRILIVPGNHDVERGKNDSLQNFKNAFKNYPNSFGITDPTSDILKCAPLYCFHELKLVVYCLSTVNTCGHVDEELESVLNSLKELEKKYPDETYKKQIDILQSRLFIDAPTITKDVIDEFAKRNQQLKELVPESDNYTKIVISHHPLLPIKEEFIELKAFSHVIGGINFAYYASEEFGYQLFVHGHSHTQNVSIHQPDGTSGKKLLNIGTPSMSAKAKDNGIALIQLDDNNTRISVTFRSFDNYRRSFSQVNAAGNFALNNKNINDTSIPYKHISNTKLLVDYEIKKVITEGKIIKNADIDRIEPASYDCAMGYKYKIDDKVYQFELSDSQPSYLSIEPGQTVIVYTAEEFDVPLNMVFHASPMSTWSRRGIIPQIGHLVDPGFKGRFCFPVTNFSNKTVKISIDEPILSIELVQLSTSAQTGWAELHADRLR